MTDPNDPVGPLRNSGKPEGWMGLTKREWMAGMALNGLVTIQKSSVSFEQYALLAIAYADALIAELNKEAKQ